MAEWLVLEVVVPAAKTASLVEWLALEGIADPAVLDPVESAPAADGYRAEVRPEALATVAVWRHTGPDARTVLERLRTLTLASPWSAVRATVREAHVDESDDDDWRSIHTPFVIEDVWRLVPHWMTAPEGRGRILVTEPGGAFGSGDHATTRDCLRALSTLVRAGDRVIDLGSGAGILSIAAAMLGAAAVVAVDIEALAGAHLRAMMEHNGSGPWPIQFVRRDWRAERLVGADVVIQNIGADDARELVLRLGATRHRPRKLLLSGIARWSLGPVEEALAETRATVLEQRSEDGEWVTLVVEPAIKTGRSAPR